MKKFMTFFLTGAAIAALGGVFTACNDSNEADEVGVDVPFTVYSLEDETSREEIPGILVDYEFWRSEVGTNKVYVVNSDEELQQYLREDYTVGGQPYPLPSIDFSTKTLLLVGGTAWANVMHATISSMQYFSSGKYKFRVELKLTIAMAWWPQWHVPVLIDKISDDPEFEVETTDAIPIDYYKL